MARTKQTARKSTGGRAPHRLQSVTSAAQFRSFMTNRQHVDHSSQYRVKGGKGLGKGGSAVIHRGENAAPRAAGAGSASPVQTQIQKTSYLNYENMFYSYSFATGARPAVAFEPRFVAGELANPVNLHKERWLGMNLNSMFDGTGMKVHGRPDVNLVVVLDISVSMSAGMEQAAFPVHGQTESKLATAKACLLSIVDQLRKTDSMGLVLFNQDATVELPLQNFGKLSKQDLKMKISDIRAGGMTNLSKAAKTAASLFTTAAESASSTNRLLFLTDLDSACSEKTLLTVLEKQAKRGVYTSVVGIGIDLNVHLVEQISLIRGARYLSVDSAPEFKRLIDKELNYDMTIIAFDINISITSEDVIWTKGHGSPEINDIKKSEPAVLSSEFPCWQDKNGQSKGGIMVFKVQPKTAGAEMPAHIDVKTTWKDVNGRSHVKQVTVEVQRGNDVDSGLRKAVAIIHYVDLHNDYVLDQCKHKMKFLELFQGFRANFVSEMAKSGDDTLDSDNQGDLELLDKIIALETPGGGDNALAQPDGCLPAASPLQGAIRRVSNFASSVRSAFSSHGAAPVDKQVPVRSAPARAPPVKRQVPVHAVPARAAKASAVATSPAPSARPRRQAATKKVQFASIPATVSKPPSRTTAAAATRQAKAASRKRQPAKPATAKGTKQVPVQARTAAGQRRRQLARDKTSRKPHVVVPTPAARGRKSVTSAATAMQKTSGATAKAKASQKQPRRTPVAAASPIVSPVSRKRPASHQLQPATRKRTKKA